MVSGKLFGDRKGFLVFFSNVCFSEGYDTDCKPLKAGYRGSEGENYGKNHLTLFLFFFF